MERPENLNKTTIVIWSDVDPQGMTIEELAREATRGGSYCSKKRDELGVDPEEDEDWDGTEFFGIPPEDE